MYTDVQIRGAHFRGNDIRALSDSLQLGETLTFEREPENPHDAYAIKAIYQGFHIGYVQREVAAFVALDMDDGVEFTGTITGRMQAGRASYPIVDILPVSDEPEFKIEMPEYDPALRDK